MLSFHHDKRRGIERVEQRQLGQLGLLVRIGEEKASVKRME